MSSPGGRPNRASRAIALVLLHAVLGITAAAQASSLSVLVAWLVITPTVVAHAAAVVDVVSAVRPASDAESARRRLISIGRRSLLVDLLPSLATGMQLTPQLIGTASDATDVVLWCALAATPLRMYVAWWAPTAIDKLPVPLNLVQPDGMEHWIRTAATTELRGLRLMVPLATVVAGLTTLLTFGMTGTLPGTGGVLLLAVIPTVAFALGQALAPGARSMGEIVRFGSIVPMAVDATHRAAGAALPTIYAVFAALAATAAVDQAGVMVVVSLSAIGPALFHNVVRQWQILRLAVGDDKVFGSGLDRAARRYRNPDHQPH